MDLLPSAEQRALVDGVRELLARRFPLERLGEAVDTAVWAALWKELAATGVFDLRGDERPGGLGLGMVEAALIFAELGRAAVPGPLVATQLCAGLLDGPVTLLDPGARPLLVTHLERAAHVVVLDAAGPYAVPPGTLEATPVRTPLDPLTPVHELAGLPAGRRLGDAALAARWRRDGALLTAALQVGLAARLTELAVGYAGRREQFGRPVGSFQAVQHLCADMLVRTELARAAVDAAALAVDDPAVGDPARAASTAKLLADEAAGANGRACVQVHGGMGFTWEVPVHFLVKRAWVHATELGTFEEHAETVAALL